MRSQARKRWICSFSIVILGGALLALLGRLLTPPDPFVLGKRLSAWLRVYRPDSNANLGSPQRTAADQAVRTLGEKAIPLLLRELQVEDSRFALWCYRYVRSARLIAGPHTRAADRNTAASRAFLALGSAASNAVPALIEIREQSASLDAQCAAVYALSWVGSAAQPALPILLRDAVSENPRLQAGALWALGEVRAQSSVAVPLLINALTSSNAWVQASAAHALGNFGALAGSAIPALSAAAKRVAIFHSDRSVAARVEALNAIQKIEAAERAQADPLTVFSLQ